MADRLISANKPKFWYLHWTWFQAWVPASAGSLSIDGAGVEVFVCSTPAMGASFSFCSRLQWMGNK